MTEQSSAEVRQEPAGNAPRKRRTVIRRILGGVIILSAVLVVSVLLAIGRQSGGNSSGATRTVATFSGSGNENTQRFAVASTWKLRYSFDCAGTPGNFVIYEDGGQDSALWVNDLADSKNASTYAYNDAGTHYLEIFSVCDWTVKVSD